MEFYSSPLDHYYTKLAELKIQMIAEASKYASAIAKSIAENVAVNLRSLKKQIWVFYKLQVKTPLKTFLMVDRLTRNLKIRRLQLPCDWSIK